MATVMCMVVAVKVVGLVVMAAAAAMVVDTAAHLEDPHIRQLRRQVRRGVVSVARPLRGRRPPSAP